MIDFRNRNCQLCGQRTELFSPKNPNLFKCIACGVVFDESSMIEKNYYENERVTHVDEKKIKSRKRNVKQRVTLIKSIFKKDLSLLDIGCGEGLFLQEVKKYVRTVSGIEPTKYYARYAKEHMHLDVRQGVIEDIDFPANSFDIVTMFHVLEHLHSPSEALSKIYSWLTPGGKIVIEVPNIESATARYKGLNWELIYPEHKFYFSPSSLEYLLRKNKFEITTTQSRDFDQYRTGIGTNLRKLGIIFGNIKSKKQLKTNAKAMHICANDTPAKSRDSKLRLIRKTIQLPLKAFLGCLVMKLNRSDYILVVAKKPDESK